MDAILPPGLSPGAEQHQSRALIPVLEKIPERSDIEKINMRTSLKNNRQGRASPGNLGKEPGETKLMPVLFKKPSES